MCINEIIFFSDMSGTTKCPGNGILRRSARLAKKQHIPETSESPFCPYKMGAFHSSSHDVPGWCKYCYPSEQETGSPEKMNFGIKTLRRSARIQAIRNPHKSVKRGEAESSIDQEYSISQPVHRSLRLQKHKGEVEQFHCYTCDLKFNNSEDFTEHKQEAHIEEDNFVKSQLGNESSAPLIGHSNNKNVATQPQFKCRTCKKVYNQKRNLVRHEKTKHSRKEGLIKHIKEEHRIQCQICEKNFKQKRYLRRHIKMHAATENDRIKCPDCSATFAREDNMKKHQVYKHLDPTHCFKCKICHKIYKHEQTMLRHIINVTFVMQSSTKRAILLATLINMQEQVKIK